jgi:predicted transposase YbfD/YdcC
MNGKTAQETRYYITSLVMAAILLGPIVRAHWAVESVLQTHTERKFAMNG